MTRLASIPQAALYLCCFATTTVLPAQYQSWVQENPTTTPPSRAMAAMAFFAPIGQPVLFGGYDNSGTRLDDMWSYDGADWIAIPQSGSWPAQRYGHSMVFDSARGCLVLFGGTDSGYYDETWEWTNAGWVQRSPNPVPAGRVYAAMSYDPVRHVTYMFGGYPGSGGLLGDLWSWDGTDWTQIPQTVNWPAARSSAVMVYDALRDRHVLFGGWGQAALSDTWEWDGSTWTDVTPQLPAISPSPRQGHHMVYDPQARLTVLFGGDDISTVFDDTWTWDGGTWTDITSSLGSSPPQRHGGTVAHDAMHGKNVLFGGCPAVSGTSVQGDTWTLSVPAPSIALTPTWTRQFGTSAQDEGMWVGALPGGDTIHVSLIGAPIYNNNPNTGGGWDILVERFGAHSSSGCETALWHREYGSTGDDAPQTGAITISGQYVYVVGYTTGAFPDFAQGNNAYHTPSGGRDLFVMKLDAATGQAVWSYQGGSADDENPGSIVLDAAGNSYISGWTRDSYFGPIQGPGDFFALSLDPSAVLRWGSQWGSTGHEPSLRLAYDPAQGLYGVGATDGTVPNATPSRGSWDVYVCQLDPANGSVLWNDTWGTTGHDELFDCAFDATGALHAVGLSSGTLQGRTSHGGYDAIYYRFDVSQHTAVASSQFGSAGSDRFEYIALPQAINGQVYAYCVGSTDGDVWGTNAGSRDIIVCALDTATLLPVAAGQWGTSGYDVADDACADVFGDVYVSATTTGNLFGSNAGGYDAIYCRLEHAALLGAWTDLAGGTTTGPHNPAMTGRGGILGCDLAVKIGPVPTRGLVLIGFGALSSINQPWGTGTLHVPFAPSWLVYVESPQPCGAGAFAWRNFGTIPNFAGIRGLPLLFQGITLDLGNPLLELTGGVWVILQ